MDPVKEISLIPMFNDFNSIESASPEKFGFSHVEQLLTLSGGFKVESAEAAISGSFEGSPLQNHNRQST